MRMAAAEHGGVRCDEQVSHPAVSAPPAISAMRASQEWPAASRERSARASGESAARQLLERARRRTRRRRAVTIPSTPRERGQRRGDHRQPGSQVLVDLHREDARGQLVERVGDERRVGAAQDVRELVVGARAEQVHVGLALASAETSVLGSPSAHGSDQREGPVGPRGERAPPAARRRAWWPTIAPVKTMRGPGSASSAGSTAAVARAPARRARCRRRSASPRPCQRSGAAARPAARRVASTRSARPAKRFSAARKLAASMPFWAAMSSTQW